ncbi:MAG: PRC-barrel domain-containing protein, partial [Balneolales bacterium]
MAAFCLALFTWLPGQGAYALQQEGQQNEQEKDVQLGEGQEYGEQKQGKKGHKGTELIDKDVVDSEGNRLGTISDVAVDLQNSRITYVLISDGEMAGMEQDPAQQDPTQQDPAQDDPAQQDPAQQGQEDMQAGMNDQFKAVPPQALNESEEGELELDINQQEWAEAPTFGKQELAQQGMDSQQGQEVYAFYGQQWDTSDLSMLQEGEQGQEGEQDQAEAIPQPEDEQDPESGPSAADTLEHQGDDGTAQHQEQPQAMEEQQAGNELTYMEDIQGKTVVDQQQEEIGEVDEFLLDLEEGRLAFVVVSSSNGMGSGQQQQDDPLQQDPEQQQDPQQQGQAGQQDQQQHGQASMQGGQRYAIAPNAFEPSQEQQDQLVVNIERQELEQAQQLDSESWIDQDSQS